MHLIMHYPVGFKKSGLIQLLLFILLLSIKSTYADQYVASSKIGEGAHWLSNPLDQLNDWPIDYSDTDFHNNLHDRKLIDWVLSLADHGIGVPDSVRKSLKQPPSGATIRDIVSEYAIYLDQGKQSQLKRQSRWYIEDQINTPLPEGHLELSALQELESKLPQYQQLKQLLARLKQWLLDARVLFPDNLVFKPGIQNDHIAALNRWLLDTGHHYSLSGITYTLVHQYIIRDIQREAGIKADGDFSARTRDILLAITRQRIQMVKLNMERMRWLPKVLPYPHVMVDIAGFQVVWAESEEQQRHFKAIVGKPSRKTPIFQDEIESITVNPVWRVPHSIASTSLLAAEQQSPGYLDQQGFIVYKGWRESAPTLSPAYIKWQQWTAKTFPYRIEQLPGANNRLGQFRLDSPNPFNVYLHDTDKPDLFGRSVRALSAGCTRVNNIEQLVDAILLSQKTDLDLTNVSELGKTKKIMLSYSIPVYFLYFTVWADKKGRIDYRDDIYRFDLNNG